MGQCGEERERWRETEVGSQRDGEPGRERVREMESQGDEKTER